MTSSTESVATRWVYAPVAGIDLYFHCLLRGAKLVCFNARGLIRRSARVEYFDARKVDKYYLKHAGYERQIVRQCNPLSLRDAFAYQLYIEDVLRYLVPYFVLRESRQVRLAAPCKLKSALFPPDTLFRWSPLDWYRRLKAAHGFSRIYFKVSGDEAEFSYVPFQGAEARPVHKWWSAMFHRLDFDFYRAVYDRVLAAVEHTPELCQVRRVKTRKLRDTSEWCENIAFEFCERYGKVSCGAQERTIYDFPIFFSFSSYHEFQFWDAESLHIFTELCHHNRVVQPTLRAHPVQAAVLAKGRGGRRLLAFPAQVENPMVFSNSAHCDVHLAEEFRRFLLDLAADGFSVMVKLKMPQEAQYFSGLPQSTARDYNSLISQFDCFVSGGYTTPGLDLRMRGLRSFYFFPAHPGPRLYPAITVSSASEFMAALAEA